MKERRLMWNRRRRLHARVGGRCCRCRTGARATAVAGRARPGPWRQTRRCCPCADDHGGRVAQPRARTANGGAAGAELRLHRPASTSCSLQTVAVGATGSARLALARGRQPAAGEHHDRPRQRHAENQAASRRAFHRVRAGSSIPADSTTYCIQNLTSTAAGIAPAGAAAAATTRARVDARRASRRRSRSQRCSRRRRPPA